MSGCSKWQMLRFVYLPSARTEILVGLNQVIMLCLAMVVLTAAIGMPGLGAKLLAMMGSFKLGRSFEIGITIVLLAVTLDRLSKAWVVKQPEHFEKGTPWWRQHILLLVGIGAALFFMLASEFVQVFDHIKRNQDFSQGKEFDKVIKSMLALDWVRATTNTIRYFVNVWILVPTENVMLYVPTSAMILGITAICYRMGGFMPGLLALIFFCIVAELGYWDRAMLTLHSVLTATTLAFLFGAPLAIYAVQSAKRSHYMILLCDTLQTFPSYVYLLPAVMLFGVSPVTVIISILIYTMVPVIRYTVEGLRNVPSEITEAAEMSGAITPKEAAQVGIDTAFQLLRNRQKGRTT